MSEPLLVAHGVSKTYQIGKRALEVLKGVNVLVELGDFVALRGSSGAGKSTLLHLLGGLDTPTAGEIWFGGRNLATFSTAQLAQFRNAKVGFVFQAYHLLPELDALENVCLPARIARESVGPVENARGICSNAWAWATGWSIGRLNCPAANSNAWPSRARSSAIPRCCSPTNRPAISTRTPGTKSSTCSADCAPKARPR